MYLAVEGIDGSGKSLQVELLANRLLHQGQKALQVAEPCVDFPQGRILRGLLASGEHPESHAALFLADRMALQAAAIVPALGAGRHVLSARSFVSTLCYQQEHWPLPWLLDIHKQMLAHPDVLVLLDIDPVCSLNRAGKRELPREVYEREDILTRNRERYRELVTPEGVHHHLLLELMAEDPAFVFLDATPPPEIVHETLWQELQNRGLV